MYSLEVGESLRERVHQRSGARRELKPQGYAFRCSMRHLSPSYGRKRPSMDPVEEVITTGLELDTLPDCTTMTYNTTTQRRYLPLELEQEAQLGKQDGQQRTQERRRENASNLHLPE